MKRCGWISASLAAMTGLALLLGDAPAHAQSNNVSRFVSNPTTGGCTFQWLEGGWSSGTRLTWTGECVRGQPANGQGRLNWVHGGSRGYFEGRMINGYLDGLVVDYGECFDNCYPAPGGDPPRTVTYIMGCQEIQVVEFRNCVPASRSTRAEDDESDATAPTQVLGAPPQGPAQVAQGAGIAPLPAQPDSRGTAPYAYTPPAVVNVDPDSDGQRPHSPERSYVNEQTGQPCVQFVRGEHRDASTATYRHVEHYMHFRNTCVGTFTIVGEIRPAGALSDPSFRTRSNGIGGHSESHLICVDDGRANSCDGWLNYSVR